MADGLTTSAADEDLQATLQHVVAPPLEGRTPTGFRELAAEMDALTETVTVTSTRRPPADEGDAGEEGEGRQGFSRRALLTAPSAASNRFGRGARIRAGLFRPARGDWRLVLSQRPRRGQGGPPPARGP